MVRYPHSVLLRQLAAPVLLVYLDSILANDYPPERLEILLLDGMSTDHSRQIADRYAQRYPFIRVLDNPRRLQVAAMNAGIRAAKGDMILGLDAHTAYANDYIRRCVELLQTTEADNVGGVQRAVGTNYMSRAIAIASTTLFGVGDAYYRFADKPLWVDTVYLGAWRKTTLERLGGFNEAWEVNEDYELNYRLRKAGGKILLSPDIRCRYFVRDSLRKLAHQYFRYGIWRVKTLTAHPDSLQVRQLAAPLFVLGLLASIVVGLFSPVWGWALPLTYLGCNLLASSRVAARHGWKFLPVLPAIYAVLHLSCGTGFLVGLCRFGIPKLTPKRVVGSLRTAIRRSG